MVVPRVPAGRRRATLVRRLAHPAWQGVAALVAMAGIAVAIILAADPFHTGQPSDAAAAEPRLVVGYDGYVLRRSSFLDTNDQDKVDVDTGCPGWGGMSPRVGPSRCGELADIILDQEGIHTAEGRPRLVSLLPGQVGGYQSCQVALAARPSPAVAEIGVRRLQTQREFCVRTDLGNLAAVVTEELVVDGSGQLESMTISFRTWAPEGP